MRKVSGVYLPKPPKGADHILLNVTDDCCGPKRRALVLIHDIDVLIGKVIKEFDPEYTWNGNYIQELEDEIKEKEKESK